MSEKLERRPRGEGGAYVVGENSVERVERTVQMDELAHPRHNKPLEAAPEAAKPSRKQK